MMIKRTCFLCEKCHFYNDRWLVLATSGSCHMVVGFIQSRLVIAC
ncbi:hypothetical protein EVA_18572 [gut metagenome]|uniref:Uncharacterized protein n=1 Tax=gut metagenome TaxID=749906 RepID=J9C0H0_9ZZZZ